jgi:hypothetical protein
MRDSLYVAPSTMRTRVKSIYRKLGISPPVGKPWKRLIWPGHQPAYPLGETLHWVRTDRSVMP